VPRLGDHHRPTDADERAGVYRVVGADGDGVTLLRVGDDDGRRVHTGELTRVRSLDGFAPADAPSGGATTNLTYWTARAFAAELAARPAASAVALALVAAGAVADLPGPLGAVALVAGSLGAAYVGSGRLRG
jgi:hypothetical protein